MIRKLILTLYLLMVIALATSCVPALISPTPQTNLPNPASVFCEENGGSVVFRQDASGATAGVCVFPDGSECDEWAFWRGECSPGATEIPAGIPTALPVNPEGYQGWQTYTHPVYNFSLRYPSDWIAEETTGESTWAGHQLCLSPQTTEAQAHLCVTYRTAGEDVLLWPTGVGEGEFVQQGTLQVAGQSVRRTLLVCPSGDVTSIWYQDEGSPEMSRGALQFGILFRASDIHCEAGASLGGDLQLTGEMIITSLSVP